MKKNLTFLLFILIAFYSKSQQTVNVPTGEDLKPFGNVKDHNQWYYGTIKKDSSLDHYYTMYFEQTTVGIRYAIKRAKEFCEKSGFDFNKPGIDNNILASYVHGLSDYENLNLSIKTGGSEIDMFWDYPKDGSVMLQLLKNKYSLTIYKIEYLK